jgi:hypothetical protein
MRKLNYRQESSKSVESTLWQPAVEDYTDTQAKTHIPKLRRPYPGQDVYTQTKCTQQTRPAEERRREEIAEAKPTTEFFFPCRPQATSARLADERFRKTGPRLLPRDTSEHTGLDEPSVGLHQNSSPRGILQIWTRSEPSTAALPTFIYSAPFTRRNPGSTRQISSIANLSS